MDVLFFFKQRTRFIRHFYETAGMPFRETKRKIEAKEPPFDDPPYSEDGEPPYVEEWIAASEAQEVLGRTCLSMLSTSLQLYFMTWEKNSRFEGSVKNASVCSSMASFSITEPALQKFSGYHGRTVPPTLN